jgi:predicted O-linked N-acetylglucosamine transferase (SPINDLY family)
LPCFQTNDDAQAVSPRSFPRAALGLPENGIVFCAFNSVFKITPEVFGAWMRILERVPGSVLWLVAGNPTARNHLRDEASRRGIDGGRLVFAESMPLEEHLARLRQADLFLDNHPYNAGATASNALRMGVPVITRIGEAFAARMGASLLQAVGLPELIVTTVEAYEDLAVALATDKARLRELRHRLTDIAATSRLFDTERATRDIERLYTQMYARSREGLPPIHLRA